ncbi:MAG TPA: hypothetical protein PLP88_03920 [Bacteroidales bacterium]|nr:hypothetical protein [Bacteroidales bacterium]
MKRLIAFLAAAALISACSNNGGNNQKASENNNQNHIEITNDMENALSMIPSWYNENHVIKMSEPPAHSGSYACITDETLQYSYTFKELLKNINEGVPKLVTVSGWMYATEPNPVISIICNVDENKKSISWKAVPLKDELNEAGKWVEFTANFYYNDVQLKPENELGILAWNQDKKTVYIDDLKITLEY